jgi:hypothetical protein
VHNVVVFQNHEYEPLVITESRNQLDITLLFSIPDRGQLCECGGVADRQLADLARDLAVGGNLTYAEPMLFALSSKDPGKTLRTERRRGATWSGYDSNAACSQILRLPKINTMLRKAFCIGELILRN